MRTGLNLICLGFFTLLTACGGGDASLHEDAQRRSENGKSQIKTEGDALLQNELNTQNYLTLPVASDVIPGKTISEGVLADDTPKSAQTLRAGCFSSYVPTGWIDDEFNRAYVFTFTGGLGASAYQPPKKTDPVPPVPSSNVGGLSAYETPAMPIFRPIPQPLGWKGEGEAGAIPLTANWSTFLYHSMACAPACAMVISDLSYGSSSFYLFRSSAWQQSNFFRRP